MSDAIAAVSRVRRRVDEASALHARARAQAEAAAADAQRILGVLAEEFDVSSVTEATRLLELYSSQIDEQVRIVEASLAEAEDGVPS